MFFRSKRYILSSGDTESSSSQSRTRRARPNTAPSGGGSSSSSTSSVNPIINNSNSDISTVEQRLRIVKRNRIKRTPDVSYIPSNVSRKPSPPFKPPAAADPPCAVYPTFDLSGLSKHEENILQALVIELTDAIAFPTTERN